VEHSRNGFRSSNIFICLLWLNFVALWVRVYTFASTKHDAAVSLSYIGKVTVLYGLLVTAWVVHNIRIFRKKGPRLRARLAGFSQTHDSLNHQINTAVDLGREQEIVVDVIRGQKFFLKRSHPAIYLTFPKVET
jgi:hypothetical protein